MTADTSAADAELLAFTTLLDQLADNQVGAIGARQIRSIVKSLAPRYASLSVREYTPSWSSTAAGLAFGDATNYRFLANGFNPETTGELTYLGSIPMLVELDFSAVVDGSGSGTVEIALSHTNPFERLDEPLFSVNIDVNSGAPYVGSALFVVSAGSQVVATARTVGSVSNLQVLEYNLGLKTSILTPSAVEIRRGDYGSVNATGAVYSVVPFQSLYHIINKTTTPTLPTGTFGLDPATMVMPGGSYTPSANNVLVVKAGSPATWSAVGGDGAKKLHFTTTPFDPSPIPPRPSNSIGADGDFVAYGYNTDLKIPVWGPKANGAWPVFPRNVSLLTATT